MQSCNGKCTQRLLCSINDNSKIRFVVGNGFNIGFFA
jgi:hypothetical protein